MSITIGGKIPQSISIGGKAVASLSINGEVVWSDTPSGPDYFYIENIYNGQNTIKSSVHGTPSSSNVEYSVNGSSWTPIDLSTTTLNVALNSGEKLYMRSTNGLGNTSTSNYVSLYTTQNVNVGGDLKTLIDYRDATIDTIPSFAFCGLFYGSSTNKFKVVDASNLTMDGILYADSNSLYNTFRGCTTLITPLRELPAKYGSYQCYGSSFRGCSNMTSAPVIKIDSLWSGHNVQSILAYTFMDCTSLQFIDLSNIKFNATGSHGASSMLENCTSLQGPVIIKDQGDSYSFANMFKNCSSLDDIRYLGSSWDSTKANDWVSGVAATGDFYNLGGATLPTGTNGIPSGWTTHTSL